MTYIAATAAASIAKPNTLAISVSRRCLRSLRLYAEFILSPVVYLVGLTITTVASGYYKPARLLRIPFAHNQPPMRLLFH